MQKIENIAMQTIDYFFNFNFKVSQQSTFI